MDRYSNLYGTVGAGGIYSSMGSSPNLPAFLNRIGAVNPTSAVEAVRNTLAGFPKMDASAAGFRENYYSQPKNDLPVAVRYAPMHLYKKPGMPKNMQPFCALSINGSENKQEGNDNRFTVYFHTFYIAREHMHEAVNVKDGGTEKRITYLDQIFGTKKLDHVQVADFRNGKAAVDFDALPEKVVPVMNPHDQAVVFNAVSAVFEGKSIVIRLEKDCGFNSRAWELLIPIYSLMPPRLATEIGFATYQEPNAIREMVADTSIRIFVLPAECELKAVENTEILVMDLNAPNTIPAVPRDDLGKMLNRWSMLSWDLRQVAMEKLFFDTEATFQDKTLFIQRSREFFTDGFFTWERSDEDKGTISSLEELKEKFDSFSLCARIPWVKERFAKKVPMLLKKGTTLQRLTADALAAALYSKDEEEKKQAQQLYRFATDLLDADAILGAKATGKLVRAQTQAEDDETLRKNMDAAKASIAAEQKKTAEAIAAGEAALAQAKTEAAAAVAAERKKTEEAITAGEAALAQAKTEAAAAVAAERKKTEEAITAGEAALAQAKTEAAAAIAAERKKTEETAAAGAAALAQAKTEAAAAVAAERKKTEETAAAGAAALAQAKTEAAAAIAAERKKTEETAAAGAATLAQAKTEAAAAVAAERKKTEETAAAGAAALAQAKTEEAAAIAAEQKKTEQVKTDADEKIKAERDAHQVTRQKLDAETGAHHATRQKLDIESQNHQATRQQLVSSKQERDSLNQQLEKSKEEYTKLKQAKAFSDSKVAAAEKAKAEADQIIVKHEQLCTDLEDRKAKYNEMIRKTNQRMVVFAAAGFLAASLIFGVVMLIVGLTGDNKPEPVTEPTSTVEMTEALTEPTEIPTDSTEAAP